MHCFRSLSRRSITSRSSVYRPQMAYLPSRSQILVTGTPRVHFSSRSNPLLNEEDNKRKEEADLEEPQDELADAQPEPGHKDLLIKQLEKQLEEFTNGWKSAQAEAENVRKIMTRDVSRAREGGIDKLAKKLFPMSDTLDICIQNKPDFESAAHKDNEHAKRAFDGIQAAKQQLVSILKDVNVEEVIPKLGEPFDPSYHDALFEVDPPADKSLPPGTIGLILKVGWKRDSVLLRPANVGVVRKY